MFEFQIAKVTKEDPPYDEIKKFAAGMADKYADQGAVRIPVLPEIVSEKFILPYVQKGDLSQVPIGVEKATLDVSYYNLVQSVVTLVLSTNREWSGFVDALGNVLSKHCGINTIILAANEKVKNESPSERQRVFCGADNCVKAVTDIFETVLKRNNEYKDKLAEGEDLPEYEPLVVIIKSMSQLKNLLELRKPSDENREASDDTPLNRLQLAMEKCNKEYNVHFIVAESINALASSTVENWYKTHINGNNGIWVGSGISSQFRLNVSKKPSEYSSDIEDCFGFVISNAAATFVKLLQ